MVLGQNKSLFSIAWPHFKKKQLHQHVSGRQEYLIKQLDVLFW